MAHDAELNRRYQQLATLWTAAQPTVAAFIASMVRDHHAAEDLLQKTAAALVAKFDEYDPARPFAKWAIGVARFEVLNHLRRVGTDPHRFAADTLDAVADAYAGMQDELADRKVALAKCLDEAEPRSRLLLEMCYVDNLPPSRVAERVGISANAARVTLHRIRAALRQCIERRLGEGGAR